MKRALISVFDKTGIVEFSKELSALGFEIISTGGTWKLLKEAGIPGLLEVSHVTSFPEMLDGRVKTLHPHIHGAILAVRDNSEHMRQILEHKITPIDIVVNNLYPFKQTILRPGVTLEGAIENIDIGGPSMLRAAAKNYQDVTVLIDPSDYAGVIEEIKANGKVSKDTNFKLSTKVFMHTAHYDALIFQYLSSKAESNNFPDLMTLTYEKHMNMRYGENPHQTAAFYKEVDPAVGSITGLELLHGENLSYNNVNDAHGALELLREFDGPTCVASKHSNPCGVGTGENILQAWTKAYEADPKSVYGGIIAVNHEIDEPTAKSMKKILLDIIIAPSYSPDALEILKLKKNTRILALPNITTKQPPNAFDFKKVSGGLLVQNIDSPLLLDGELVVVTKRKPAEQEIGDLLFAWKVVKHTKSNAIAIAKNGQSVGIGCGQVNRVWAAKQAIEHAVESLSEDATRGAALASDAFFPFSDCVESAAAAGITAIIQPGGSIRDQDSIAACDKHGITMIFTGMRHFRH